MNAFPERFEWSDRIKYKIKKNNFFGLEGQQFNGAKEKWMCGGLIDRETMINQFNKGCKI